MEVCIHAISASYFYYRCFFINYLWIIQNAKASCVIRKTSASCLSSWYYIWSSNSVDIWYRRYVVENAMDWISIVADGFVSLLQVLIIPIVFIAILRAFTNSKFTEGFGKIGGLSIGFLVGTVIIAGAIGVLSA